jgi:hypothetical protein
MKAFEKINILFDRIVRIVSKYEISSDISIILSSMNSKEGVNKALLIAKNLKEIEKEYILEKLNNYENGDSDDKLLINEYINMLYKIILSI